MNSKITATVDLDFVEMGRRDGLDRGGSSQAGYKLFDAK